MPPFEYTPKILKLVTDIRNHLPILEEEGAPSHFDGLKAYSLAVVVHETLSLENRLSLDDVRGVDPKNKTYCSDSVAPFDGIEVQNAFLLHGRIESLDPFDSQSLLEAYESLTQGINIPSPCWKAILDPRHANLPAVRVARLHMKQLYHFMVTDDDTPLLLKACFYLYTLRRLNIFGPWNERVARVMYRRFLMTLDPLFSHVPFPFRETIFAYKSALRMTDHRKSVSALMEYYLEVTLEGLLKFKADLMKSSINFNNAFKDADEQPLQNLSLRHFSISI